jgi:hypothetical protein
MADFRLYSLLRVTRHFPLSILSLCPAAAASTRFIYHQILLSFIFQSLDRTERGSSISRPPPRPRPHSVLRGTTTKCGNRKHMFHFLSNNLFLQLLANESTVNCDTIGLIDPVRAVGRRRRTGTKWRKGLTDISQIAYLFVL